jgi:N6-L-threonylcarbamoyladenine synthase
LPYPGGPLIDKYAQLGNPLAFKFPEPQIKDLNYSFSGFKTAILYFIRDKQKENPNFIEQNLNDICASVQYSIVNILLNKLKKAAKLYQINEIAIAGGVSANSGLRNSLLSLEEKLGWKVYIPAFQYCTDNAGMIAIAGYHKFLAADFVSQNISPMARMNF